MLYCTGMSKSHNYFLIIDTDDGVVDKVSSITLKKYYDSGVKFENLIFNDKFFVFSDMTFVNNLLDTFKTKSKPMLAKFVMFRKDSDFQIDKLTELAVKLGIIYKGEQLKIDIKNCTVIFPWQQCIYDFSLLGDGNKIESIDVCDEKVVTLSGLGFKAFNYMTLNLGTKKEPNLVNLLDCFKELRNYDSSFNEGHISYIGITPSNKMFKIYISRFDIYSVQFTTVAEIKKKVNDIIKLGTTTQQFSLYLRNKLRYCKDTDVVVCKVSKKNYNKSIRELKEKYTTLQDVYKDDFVG